MHKIFTIKCIHGAYQICTAHSASPFETNINCKTTESIIAHILALHGQLPVPQPSSLLIPAPVASIPLDPPDVDLSNAVVVGQFNRSAKIPLNIDLP